MKILCIRLAHDKYLDLLQLLNTPHANGIASGISKLLKDDPNPIGVNLHWLALFIPTQPHDIFFQLHSARPDA